MVWIRRKHTFLLKLTFYVSYLSLAIYIFQNLFQAYTLKEQYKTENLQSGSFKSFPLKTKSISVGYAFLLHREERMRKNNYEDLIIQDKKTPIYHHYPLNVDMKGILEKIKKREPVSLTVINPHPFSYIINPEKTCLSSKISLVILVKSAASHMENRDAIRKTWGNITDPAIRIVFLIGSSKFNPLIMRENAFHHDIIQEDFQDVYRNNTYKTIMAFKWATTYCSGARYLLFVDDDFYVNLPNLRFFLQKFMSNVSLLSGYVLPMSEPFRDKSSKWYVSFDDYPFQRYPPYLAGGAIIASMDVAQQMATVFPYVKYLVIDDAYLGIVAYKLGIHISHNRQITDKHCQDWRLRSKIACHGFGNASVLLQTWIRLKDVTTQTGN
ncbi:beta-1,3-galactosyltransferase brn-like [Saccostrea echinata]|uniref:beta-1,3-galactosyltransferase brn-like n=1 Tax=Saccostrea echinata TaxID=191078 RepID=UPI002A80C87C|nr:beta-1,3-galactosyltransferase brn-like [Saccostrea echinata]